MKVMQLSSPTFIADADDTTPVVIDTGAMNSNWTNLIVKNPSADTACFAAAGTTEADAIAACVYPTAADSDPEAQIGKTILPGQAESYSKDPSQRYVAVIFGEGGSGPIHVAFGGAQ